MFTVIVFVFSLVFAAWESHRYYGNLNTDYPKLTATETQLQISVDDPAEAIFRGLTAQDATDGDLTDRIMVASMSHFLEPGTVNVKYVVFDSHNNSATLTRRVHYTDYVPPRFTLDKAPVYTVGNSFDLLDHVHVQDCIDGDISDRIRVVSNMVNNYSVGNYPVLLEVANSCGDTAQITLWVTYQAKEPTATVLLHDYIVYLPQGDAFDPHKYLVAVTDRNAQPLETSQVQIQGLLDTDTPGAYQLLYHYDDGTLTGCNALTVVVTERSGANAG